MEALLMLRALALAVMNAVIGKRGRIEKGKVRCYRILLTDIILLPNRGSSAIQVVVKLFQISMSFGNRQVKKRIKGACLFPTRHPSD